MWFLLHPVHVTLTSIDYVPELNSFKVFVRMYFDDFVRDYQLNGNVIQSKEFSTANVSSMNEMQKYLDEKVTLKVNEKQLSGKLKDMSLADNEISMSIEYDSGKKPASVTVKNLIMTRLYADMANMIILRINDFEEGFKLTSGMTEQTFIIN